MDALMAILVGVVFACGFYAMLRRSIATLIIGLSLLGNAANLLVLTAAGLRSGRAPLVPPGASAPAPPFADPLPQALVLTSIVISFGVLAFGAVLVQRVYDMLGAEDVHGLEETET